uniref:Uncharacterized protein n=1 Tax=Meloidogyne enterolobii TaxID=390850 RepID=A0A6V7WBU1_MELEN|nr:unnamed protein product [Meloidogyne enterolobii]
MLLFLLILFSLKFSNASFEIELKIDDDWKTDIVFQYLNLNKQIESIKLINEEIGVEYISGEYFVEENIFKFKNIPKNFLNLDKTEIASSSNSSNKEFNLNKIYFEIILNKYNGSEYKQVIKRRLDICERNGNKFNISILPNKIIQKLKENIPNNSNILNLNFKNEFEINKNEIKETNKSNKLIEELFKENEWKIYYLNLKNLNLLKNKENNLSDNEGDSNDFSWKGDEKIEGILEEINLFEGKIEDAQKIENKKEKKQLLQKITKENPNQKKKKLADIIKQEKKKSGISNKIKKKEKSEKKRKQNKYNEYNYGKKDFVPF